MTTTYYVAVHINKDYPFVFFTDKAERDDYIESNECYFPYMEEDDMSITTDKTTVNLKVIFGPDGFWGVKLENEPISDEDELDICYYSNCSLTTI